MIYITGDTHGFVMDRLNAKAFPEQKEMTKDDYVIILGDFGVIWNFKSGSQSEKYELDWLEDKPFTVLFIDGNHENFARLNSEFPVKEWHGGHVHELRPHVFHLMRGEMFDIDGLNFFTMGGATSHDIQDGILDPETDKATIKAWMNDPYKMFRIKNRSWWAEEMPNDAEFAHATETLDKHNWKCDFVLSHCAPTSDVYFLMGNDAGHDKLTDFFENVRAKLDYKKWFFGHYHMDKQINISDICLYEQIVHIS